MFPYLKDAEIRKPPPDVLKRRRALFDQLNALVIEGGGWITSTPGNRDVVVECLPGSRLPNVLADLGHNLAPEPGGERILPVAVSQKMTRNADGTLGTLTPGSTQPTTMVVHHPGVHKTRRFSFNVP
jgi:hypothetical protein